MRRIVFAAALLFWTGQALAQVVEVRAGEHASFTRLVFYLPERVAFSVERAGKTAIVSFQRPDLAIDASAVFKRIPRSRLISLDTLAGGASARLSLACDCEIRTFWHTRSALVLDILDEPVGTWAGQAADVQTIDLNPLPLPANRPSISARLVASRLDADKQRDRPPRDIRSDARTLVASQKNLLEQVGRAASQGLLSPARRIKVKASRKKPASHVEEATAPVVGTTKAEPENFNLRAESSIDRDLRAARSRGDTPALSPRCLDPALVDVTGWIDARPFPVQVAARRTRLLKEFDSPDPAATIALARLYVAFGFGAEARVAIAQLGGQSLPERVILAMSDILEIGHAREGSALMAQMDCSPSAALWSALSYSKIPANEPMDTDAILRGLSALPTHLRAYLGPMLAERLLDAGHRRESDLVRRILERSDATATPEADLVSAEIALSRGDTQEAEKTLEALAAKNADPSARALLRLVNSRLDRDAEISHETAQFVGAYAMEYRGTALGQALSQAHVLALAASGAFDAAFATFDKQAQTAASPLGSQLVDILTQRAEDFDFLRLISSASAARPDVLDPATTNDVIRRLLSLGFVDEAARFAGSDITGPTARQRRMLRAEIALSKNRPRQAERELLGLSGTDADLLRARAKSSSGEHLEARNLFDDLGRKAKARREAWLGADWQALADDEVSSVSEIATARLNPVNPLKSGGTGVLERNRQLLEASDATRKRIDGLLSEWTIPETPGLPASNPERAQ